MKNIQSEKELRKTIREEADLTPSALSMRVRTVKDKDRTISSRLALGVVAAREGIHLEKFFNADELKEIRNLERTSPIFSVASTREKKAEKKKEAKTVNIKLPNNNVFADPALKQKVANEAREMAEVFPYFYLLENSIRNLVLDVMTQKYGSNWWDTQLTTKKLEKLNDKYLSRTKTEKERKKWHQRRGQHPIYYIDFNDLGTIIFSKENDFFPAPLGDKIFVASLFNEVPPSRNVVCHMNPLDETHIKSIEVKYDQWLNIFR